jgi:hypothetical protein
VGENRPLIQAKSLNRTRQFLREPLIIAVQKGKIFPARDGCARVASGRRSAVALRDHGDPRAVFLEYPGSAIARAVVHNYHFKAIEFLGKRTIDSASDCRLPVVDGDYGRNANQITLFVDQCSPAGSQYSLVCDAINTGDRRPTGERLLRQQAAT